MSTRTQSLRNRCPRFATLALGSLVALAVPFSALAAEGDPDPVKLLEESVDNLYRGDSDDKGAVAVVTMKVKTSRWNRTLKMKSWSKGEEKSLIRIVEPKKEAGVTTLKNGDNIWNYLPKVDRTIKVPAGMMSGSWMGSHFTNDDLVQEARYSDDYTLKIVGRPVDGKGDWKVEAVPNPDAPVVWGKVTVTIRGVDKLPTKTEFFDERGNLVRTMEYLDIQDIGGRKIPMRMKLTPADKPAEYTEVIQEKIAFDVDIPDTTFSLQALKKK
jgi:outer membrane lipoprotein-sorting protein